MVSRWRALRFVAVALVLAAVFVAAYLFFDHTYLGQVVDEQAFSGAAEGRRLPIFRIAGMFLGSLAVVAIGGGLVLTILIGALTRRAKHTVVAIGVAALALALAELSKHVLLVRTHTGATYALNNSFPSGHATVAAAAAFAVFLVSPPRWRPLVAVLGAAFAVVAGVFTLVQQWHRPSDVVAAFLLVAACGSLGGAVLTAWGMPRAARRAGSLRVLGWLAGLSGTVSLVLFVVIWATAAAHGSRIAIAFLGGSTAILAAGGGLAAAGNRLFRELS